MSITELPDNPGSRRRPRGRGPAPGARQAGRRAGRRGYWMARCPAHDDQQAEPVRRPRARNSRSCSDATPDANRDVILDAIGLAVADVSSPRGSSPRGEWTPAAPAIAVYDYTDEQGPAAVPGAAAPPASSSPSGAPTRAARSGWAWNLKGVRRVPYRLPQLIAAVAAGRTVLRRRGREGRPRDRGRRRRRDLQPRRRREMARRLRRGSSPAPTSSSSPTRTSPAASTPPPSPRSLAGTPGRSRSSRRPEGKDAADHLAAGHGLCGFRPGRRPGPAAREGQEGQEGQEGREGRRQRRPDARRADDRARLRPPPGPRLRRPAPLRARVAPLAGLGRHAVGARHDRAGRAVDEGRSPAGSPPTPWRSRTSRSARPRSARPARRVRAGIAGALTLAGTEAGIVVTPDDLDADPFLLNCANGTLDLRTGELRDARPGRPAHQDDRRRVRPGARRRGVHRVPGARPARPGDARLPRPAHRPRPGGPRDRAHPADLLRRRRQREGHLHRRGRWPRSATTPTPPTPSC